MFGKSNRHRDNYSVTYVVWPEDGDNRKPRKEFKFKKNAVKYAMSCGAGSTIGINQDYVGGSSSGGYSWTVDWDPQFHRKHGRNRLKLYRTEDHKFSKRRGGRSKDDKMWFGYSYKICTNMEYIGHCLYHKTKTMDELMPNIKNLFELFKKQGVNFDNPKEWMVETYENQLYRGTNTLHDIPWGYWSDRCNYGRAYTIYMCYLNTVTTNVFENLESVD
jgi:hypothetical protein